MNKNFVLDVSALLAVIFNENGQELVAKKLDQAIMSSVNLSEVIAKLLEKGFSDEALQEFLIGFGFQSSDFDSKDAFNAGKLRPMTKSLGLSLGDRACIALAQRLKLPVITGDRAFMGVKNIVEIELMR